MPRRFDPIIDAPPETADVNGRAYRVNTDFRVVLAYARMMDDEGTSDQDRAVLGLSLFFGEAIQAGDVEGLADFLRWFLKRGREGEEERERGERLFDLLEDSGRVFSAFLQVYRINLKKVRMHYWTFCELLEGLPQGTHLADVIGIRARRVHPGMSASERNELARLKARYRIGGREADFMAGLFSSLRGIAD